MNDELGTGEIGSLVQPPELFSAWWCVSVCLYREEGEWPDVAIIISQSKLQGRTEPDISIPG